MEDIDGKPLDISLQMESNKFINVEEESKSSGAKNIN